MHVINQICVLLLWLHTLTFAQIPDCTLQQFLNGPMFDSNFDTTGLQTSYPAGKQIRVGCSVGYSGFFKLTCVEGKWVSKGTVCQPKSCGHPGDAQFADFNLEIGDDFVFGSKVVYTCHKGYQMVSRTNYRHCMNEGWDGVVPVCEAQQCTVLHVDRNVQVNGDPEEATYGNVVRFSCKSNSHVLSDPESAELYCDENGEWSGQAPKCIEIKCTVPPIENGHVPDRYIHEYKEHDVLHFMCNYLHRPTEDRPSKCTKVGIKAEWTPTPACEPQQCPVLHVDSNVQVNGDPEEATNGNVVRFSCKSNSDVLSDPESAELYCDENGEWSGPPPKCREIKCTVPPIENGHVPDRYIHEYEEHDVLHFMCNYLHKPTEDRPSKCTKVGIRAEWTPTPACEQITCDRKNLQEADIVLNNKQTYSYNEQVGYRCKDGYQGEFTLTCGGDGWIGRSTCTESVGCGSPPPLTDGDIKYTVKSNYSHQERVEFMCQRYYTMEGGPHRTCINGEWTGQMRCLKPCIVNEDVYRQHNITLKSSDSTFFTHDEIVEFSCARGVLVGAVAMRQRCNGGVILLPTCQ